MSDEALISGFRSLCWPDGRTAPHVSAAVVLSFRLVYTNTMLTQLAWEHPKTDQVDPVSEREDSCLQKASGVTQDREMIEELKQESDVPTEEAKKTWSWKGDV